ncbi:hypothetical protein [Halobacteriovorax sp. JY17]|uniref:hypothetical protein n=1 Tax=Halobacteriovorax sp. JY17 TaxID=2014617 RepID=UPI000C5F323B|nr:hypothetical protein [Halobacteriovorax sp. JY17]PIK14144.1 MAG: hypothetical protein CES88_14270 [Halobacteriovorax sp. JY17]
MKFITMSLALLMTISVSAAEFEGFRVENIKADKVSVYLVSGGGGYSFIISKVFKKVGTFDSDNGVIEVPTVKYEVDGWRGASHALVVTHNTPLHALNKDDKERFQDPDYVNIADRVVPTSSNIIRLQRGAISNTALRKNNRVFILSDQ